MTIIATCQHELPEGSMGNSVHYHTETCDSVEGWVPCEVWATLCDACVPLYRKWYPDSFEVIPADDGSFKKCDVCGREARYSLCKGAEMCKMPQPDGSICGGVLRAVNGGAKP